MSVLKGALGFPDTIKGNDGACTVDYSAPDLRTPVRDGGSPSVVVSYGSADLLLGRPRPFLDRPEVLDEVRLAGDAGFDPLGSRPTRRASSVIVMPSSSTLTEAGRRRVAPRGTFPARPAAQWHAPSLVFAQGGENPSALNGLQNVSAGSGPGAAVAVAAELAGLQAANDGKAPGDIGLRAGQKALASAGIDAAEGAGERPRRHAGGRGLRPPEFAATTGIPPVVRSRPVPPLAVELFVPRPGPGPCVARPYYNRCAKGASTAPSPQGTKHSEPAESPRLPGPEPRDLPAAAASSSQSA